MFRAIAKPIVPPAPSTATVSAVRAADRAPPARAGRPADVPPCAICHPLCFLGADTRPWSPLHREEGGTDPAGGVLGQAGQVGGTDGVVAVLACGRGSRVPRGA